MNYLHRISKEAYLIAFFSCAAFLFIFRPSSALSLELGSKDGLCYLEWLYRFISLAPNKCLVSYYAPGVAIAWLPFAGIAAIMSFLLDLVFTHCVEMWVGFSAFVYWLASYVIIFSLLRKYLVSGSAGVATLFTFSIPIFYYVGMHPYMAHSVELFLAVLTLNFLLKNNLWMAWGCALLLTLTRYNDFPIFLMLLGQQFDRGSFKQNKFASLCLFVSVLVGGVVLGYIGLVKGYDGDMNLARLFWWVKAEDFHRFFFSPWQGIYLHTLWVLLVGMGFYFIRQLSWMNRAALVWMTANLLISMAWDSALFGQRYLLGSYAGALSIGLEIAPWLQAKQKRVLYGAAILNSVCVVYVTLLSQTRFLPFWTELANWRGLESMKSIFGSIFSIGLSPYGFLLTQSFPKFCESLLFRPSSIPVATKPQLVFVIIASLCATLIATVSLVAIRKR